MSINTSIAQATCKDYSYTRKKHSENCFQDSHLILKSPYLHSVSGGSRVAATSKMGRFVIIVNGLQPLTLITKRSILDVAAALDPPLNTSVAFLPYSQEVLAFPKISCILNKSFQQNSDESSVVM